MATVSTLDPQFTSAIHSCVAALRRLTDYELQPSLDRRMQELGERKEFLGRAEHDELMDLVHFARQRTIDKLEAQRALQRLQGLFPDLVDAA